MRIVATASNSKEAETIMKSLSLELMNITGNDGTCSVQTEDFLLPCSIFVIAYDEEGRALGCGGIRPLAEDTGEVKRMYAAVKSKGVGTNILEFLVLWAKDAGYQRLVLETRAVNKQAVKFYEARGFTRTTNYGKYVNHPEAVCFEKSLTTL